MRHKVGVHYFHSIHGFCIKSHVLTAFVVFYASIFFETGSCNKSTTWALVFHFKYLKLLRARSICFFNFQSFLHNLTVFVFSNSCLSDFFVGATIPEETGTELEETPGTNRSAEAMTMSLGRASQTPGPANFAFRNPLISEITRVSPTFPVSFDEINSPATGGREEIDNLLTLDPFSAAPFNPATIQQHHAAQQQQQLRGLTNFSSNTTSPIPPCGVSPVCSLF